MAQSDARPIGHQEVAGSISAGSGNSLSLKLITKYSYCHFLPSADPGRAVVILWRKNVHRLTALRTKVN